MRRFTRRNFLQIGGPAAFGLSTILAGRDAAAREGRTVKDTSVVWLWLGGGPTHVETFDPKMTAPSEYRSITGEAATTIPGVTLGGNFPKMATMMDQLAIVRSFAHTNSGHAGGTHYVMTGYDYPPADNGQPQIRPSIGSVVARTRGATAQRGMPTFVRLSGIYGDGPSWLGSTYGPFGSEGEAKNNMLLRIDSNRLGNRKELLSGLSQFRELQDRQGFADGLDDYARQAFELVQSRAPQAFDLKLEDPRTVEKYGSGLGQQMLMARRLCEAGCGFVTLHFGGWDMHGQIFQAMNSLGPQVDRAVSTFLDDVRQRGLSDQILLVITGEFGRTPKINGNAGRDHWAPLSTLALAGGGLKMGQVIGESDSKVTVPKTKRITPQDLMATVFHVLGIDLKTQFHDPAGRPVYMVETGHVIQELV